MSEDAETQPELSNGDENGSVESSPSKSGSGSPKSNASSSEPAANNSKSIAGERSPEYHKLIEYGLDDKVAIRLEEIYKTGIWHWIDWNSGQICISLIFLL